MRLITATAPSHWAPYLINGDDSGLALDEILACDAWLARERLGMPVSCETAGYLRYHDAYRECSFASDCQEYAFLTE